MVMLFYSLMWFIGVVVGLFLYFFFMKGVDYEVFYLISIFVVIGVVIVIIWIKLVKDVKMVK